MLSNYTTSVDLACLLALKQDTHDHSKYVTQSHLTTNHHTKVGVEILIGQGAAQTYVDNALAGKAPVAHVHSQYVDSAALATSLLPYPTYTDVGLLLGGYEQVDSNIMRFVSATSDYVTLEYYSGGQSVQVELTTKARTEYIYATLQYQVTQGAIHMSLHAGNNHP